MSLEFKLLVNGNHVDHPQFYNCYDAERWALSNLDCNRDVVELHDEYTGYYSYVIPPQNVRREPNEQFSMLDRTEYEYNNGLPITWDEK